MRIEILPTNTSPTTRKATRIAGSSPTAQRAIEIAHLVCVGMQRVAVWCSVLQRVAVRCSALRCVAVSCSHSALGMCVGIE